MKLINFSPAISAGVLARETGLRHPACEERHDPAEHAEVRPPAGAPESAQGGVGPGGRHHRGRQACRGQAPGQGTTTAGTK